MTNHGANHGYYAEFDRQINDHPDERKERVVPAMPFVGVYDHREQPTWRH